MLEYITDKKTLSDLIFKHLGRDLLTNCYLSIKEFLDELEQNTLVYKEFKKNLYILKEREDFAILYYYICDVESAKNELEELKSMLHYKIIVTEFAYKDDPTLEEKTLKLFESSKYYISLRRTNLENKNETYLDTTCSFDNIEWKYDFDKKEDAIRIRDFLVENFNKITGCIPTIATIENKIEANLFYVLEDISLNKIVGVLEFDLDRVSTIKHLAIAQEYRGKGLGKLLVNKMINNGKGVNVWTTSNSEAEQFYKNNGFIETGYKSIVLINEEEW